MGLKTLTILAIFLLVIPMSFSAADSRTLVVDNKQYSFNPVSEGKLYLAVRNKVYFSENNGEAWSYTIFSKYAPSEVLYLLKDDSIVKLDTAASAIYKLDKHNWVEYKKMPTPKPLEVAGVYTVKKETGQAKKPSEIFTTQLLSTDLEFPPDNSSQLLPLFDMQNSKVSWIPSDISTVVVKESSMMLNAQGDVQLLANGFVLANIVFIEEECGFGPIGSMCYKVNLDVRKNNFESKRDLIEHQYLATDIFYHPICDTGVYNPSNCNIVILRIFKQDIQTLLDTYYQESFDAINIWPIVSAQSYGGVGSQPPKDGQLESGEGQLE